MACEGKTYSGLTAVMLQAIRIDLGELGMVMEEAHVGIVVHKDFGVEAEYEYREEHQTLFVRINKKPFFVPCSMIYGRMDQAIARRQVSHDPMADQ